MSHALAPFGLAYGAVVRARLALYRRGLLATHAVGAPVISIGNLTAGGTGKTPLVEWTARVIANEGRRACILTRGYGRARPRERVVVSDGERLLADEREGGDEPRLLAERLLGTASVVCDADRVAAARWAREALGAQAFILDDGFQHMRIRRDLDIVTVDATAPWGGGRLLPRGRLREPKEGLSRADCIIITRADLAHEPEHLRAEVERLSGQHARIFTSRVRTIALRELYATDRIVEPGSVDARQPAAALCGLGNPQAFFEHLRRDGHDLRLERSFPDHHRYTERELEQFVNAARQSGALMLLTTAKDGVKLRQLEMRLPCYVVEVETVIEEADALANLVREAITRDKS